MQEFLHLYYNDKEFQEFFNALQHDEELINEFDYNNIIKNWNDILSVKVWPKEHISRLDKLISFFKNKEEYEKCAKLVDLQKIIKSKNA